MIKITDGVNIKNVTLGMYENLYRKMGYTVVDEKPIVKKTEEIKEVIVEVPEDKPVKQKNDVRKVKK